MNSINLYLAIAIHTWDTFGVSAKLRSGSERGFTHQIKTNYTDIDQFTSVRVYRALQMFTLKLQHTMQIDSENFGIRCRLWLSIAYMVCWFITLKRVRFTSEGMPLVSVSGIFEVLTPFIVAIYDHTWKFDAKMYITIQSNQFIRALLTFVQLIAIW